MKIKTALRGFAIGYLAWSAAGAMAATIYVNINATGANDGVAWPDAFVDLQAALAAASAGDEIWVAQGYYKPTGDLDRTRAFAMKPGVGLYGGFLGVETAREQRDWTAHRTYLTGDLGTPGDASDNSYHVVFGADDAVLDGFTITAANNEESATLNGAGMVNDSVSPKVANCTFAGNACIGSGALGGGMLNQNASPTILACAFIYDSAAAGGGMYNFGGAPALTDCMFSSNTASVNGGGMYNASGASVSLTRCTFESNRAYKGSGGGIYNYNCSPAALDCQFTGNRADGPSTGGGMFNLDASPQVLRCTFLRNVAYQGGAGMYNVLSSPAVTGCVFIDNNRDVFAGAPGGDGGAIHNQDGAPSIVDCTFTGNYGLRGGGISTTNGSVTVNRCVMAGNFAGFHSGAMAISSTASTVTNCLFQGNLSGIDPPTGISNVGGGAVRITGSGNKTFVNCTFAGNSVSTSVTTNVFGGGMYFLGSSSFIRNCVFYGNSATNGPEIYRGTQYSASFSNCDISGSGGSAAWDAALGTDGGGNIDADPRFVNAADPAGPDGRWRTADDGLALRADSLCIDAGTSFSAPAMDILQRPRPLDGNADGQAAFDIGAYELPSPLNAAGGWMLYR